MGWFLPMGLQPLSHHNPTRWGTTWGDNPTLRSPPWDLSPRHLPVGLLRQGKDVGVHIPHLPATVGVNHLLLVDGQHLVGVDGHQDDACRKGWGLTQGRGRKALSRGGGTWAHRSRCRWRWPPGSAHGVNAALLVREGGSGPPGHPCLRGTQGCRGEAAESPGSKGEAVGLGIERILSGTRQPQGTQAGLGCRNKPITHMAPTSPSHPPGGGAGQNLLPHILWLFLLLARHGHSQESRPGHPGEGHRMDTLQTATKPSVPQCSSVSNPVLSIPTDLQGWIPSAEQGCSKSAMQSPQSRTQQQKTAKMGSKPAVGTQQQDWGMLQTQRPSRINLPLHLPAKEAALPSCRIPRKKESPQHPDPTAMHRGRGCPV